MATNDAARKELAPTGRLRVAIAVGPSASALWTVRDPATGKPKGVPVDLGTAMAQKLGVPVELVEYASSGEIVSSRDKGAWDVTFVPVDDDRKKAIDFGAPYHLLQSTYLVGAGLRDQDAGRRQPRRRAHCDRRRDGDRPCLRGGIAERHDASRSRIRTKRST